MILEVAAYTLLRFLPYIALGLYPLRHRLRFSMKVTLCLTFFASFVYFGIQYYSVSIANSNPSALSGTAARISTLSTLLYIGLFLLIIRANIGKILFLTIMLSNTANCVIIFSKCIEGLFFSELAQKYYHWSYLLIMTGIHLIIIYPMFFYLKKYFSPIIERRLLGREWFYLWTIPATYYLLWYVQMYHNDQSSIAAALDPVNNLYLLVMNCSAFLIYHMIIKLVNQQADNLELKEKFHHLTMHALEYKTLTDRITQARRAKHDMRHHITVISSYVDNEQYDQLKEYLHTYRKSLPNDDTIMFCKHHTINLLLLHFAQQAKTNSIDFKVRVDIPETLPISNHDITVLLGNLLENAIDACRIQKNEYRKIYISGTLKGDALYFTIDNTYENAVKQNKEGIYLSTKHPGTGLGIESAKNTVLNHNGILNITLKDGMFCVSVMLKIK